MPRRGLRLLLAAALALVAAPGVARAADGVSPPDAGSIVVGADGSGYVTSPATIDLVLRLDAGDAVGRVWVSASSARTKAGLPSGTAVGSCAAAGLRPGSEAGTEVCSIQTILLRPLHTYWWWVDYTRAGATATAGPYSFTLAAPGAPPPPAQASFVNALSVVHLHPARWTGKRSVRLAALGRVLRATLRARWQKTPRAVAVACWTHRDFEGLMASNGQPVSNGIDDVLGVWVPYEPHWIHLDARPCTWVERLLDTHAVDVWTAFGLVAALHETMHANGIEVEAQANCDAVQLVPTAARILGLPSARADRLGRLALTFTRTTAPKRYWNASRCRGGGAWDLDPKTKKLG